MTSFQSSELTELPVVENSQLFAQRVHSARYAPLLQFGAWAVPHKGREVEVRTQGRFGRISEDHLALYPPKG